MKRACNIRLASLTALLILGLGAWLYATATPPRLHPLGTACSSCHLAGNNTVADNASMLIASQEILCGQCHQNSMKMSHLSGFSPPPGQNIPAAYPLDWKGELTCSTCHSVHSDSHGKLRGTARGAGLCLACHAKSFFDNMPDSGTSLTSSGHLGAQIARDWKTLDQYSIQCLGCHTENGDVNLSANRILGNHGSLSHPVGRSYEAAARAGGYRNIAMLPEKILLPNGMVSCVSCHEGYSKTHGKLVTDNARSALCFECHDL